MTMKNKTSLMRFLLLLIILFASCTSYKNIESTTAIVMKCKVIRITPHEHFFEIDVTQGDNKYKVLSKRSDVIGDNIIIDNDTVSIAPNAGIYNRTFYIDYCNEIIEVKGQIQIYEADNLNGLYIK